MLQVIGLLRRRARWLVRADALVATALGVTIALIAFPLLTRAVTHLPGVPMAWTSGQARMTIAGVVAAYVLPVVVISVAGGFVVGTYLFALAVSPIVTATAPHDQLTERTIATAGRVVVFVDPVPSAQSVARLRSNPLVTGTAAMTRHGCCSPGIETPTGTWLVRSCPRPRRA